MLEEYRTETASKPSNAPGEIPAKSEDGPGQPDNRRAGKARVLLVDDHPMIRSAIQVLVDKQEDLEVCGEAVDPAETLQQIESARPDLILLDLVLKQGHGLELIGEIRRRYPGVKIIVFSGQEERHFAERCLRAGAMGFVHKQEPNRELLEAIRRVLRGEIRLGAGETRRLALQMAHSTKPTGTTALDVLSDRELELFQMIGQGLTNSEMAAQLGLSVKTVEVYRDRIKRKLQLRNSAELVRQAVQWSLVPSLPS